MLHCRRHPWSWLGSRKSTTFAFMRLHKHSRQTRDDCDMSGFSAGLDRSTTARIFAGVSSLCVWVVGDIMLDEYAIGEASRISPEAPVPVVRVRQTESRL